MGEGEGNKGTPDSLALTSPTLKKEKDIKREKDIKKELLKTEHRDPAHRTKDAKMAESELVRDLKAQLKYVRYHRYTQSRFIFSLHCRGETEFLHTYHKMEMNIWSQKGREWDEGDEALVRHVQGSREGTTR